jgi:LPS export ABC transporter protein LptC
MSGRATLGWLVVFALGVLLGTLLVNGGGSEEDAPNPAANEPTASTAPLAVPEPDPLGEGGADIVAEDIELLQGAEGRIDWKIRARLARYNQERNIVSIVRPEVFAYIGQERDEVFVRAETGEVDQEADNFRLRENVVGRYGLFALRAEEMDYIGAMGKVYLKGRVIIRRPDADIRATAIEIDVASREMVAAGGVTANLNPGAQGDDYLRTLGLDRTDQDAARGQGESE